MGKEYVPDFDELLGLVNKIKILSIRKADLDIRIHVAETEVIQKATTDTAYFVGGKPPSIAYLESTYKYTGFGGELVALRQELASTGAELEEAKTQLEIRKLMIEVWRTASANERMASL